MEPVAVAGRRRRPAGPGVLGEPPLDVVPEVLLAPQHPGERLPDHLPLRASERGREHVAVELVGLGAAPLDELVEARPNGSAGRGARSSSRSRTVALSRRAAASSTMPAAAFVPVRAGFTAAASPATTRSMPSLRRRRRSAAPNSRSALVSFSVNSSRCSPSAEQPASPSCSCSARHGPRALRHLAQRRASAPVAPRPGVAEPQRRQQAQGAPSGPRLCTVTRSSTSSGAGLGVLDDHVEVAVVGEDAGVEQLVLELAPAARAVRRDQVVVRELALRVLVEHPHVRVRRRAVEVEVVLLDVLAVVALGVGQAEEPLLEDRVRAVPHRERQAQPLSSSLMPGDAVLAPPVGARARLVVREGRQASPPAL